MIHLKSKTRKLLSLVLSIVLAAGLLPVGPFAPVEVRAANSVEYLAPDYVDTADVTKGITGFTKKEQDTYTVINSANKPTTWGSDGNTTWYVVEGNVNYGTLGTDPGTITVKGNVNLILKDGCSLNVKGALNYAGICVSGDNDSLTIYGQTEGDGELKASAGSYGAGIGGNQYGAGKNITINGGNITATGSLTGAGIGGAQGDGSNITINGGSVTATSGSGAGIGSGWGKTGSDITINGGSVTAAASEKGAGIGGGCNGAGSGITINGGTVIANGGQAKDNFGAGIGGGSGGNGSNIKISGGKVQAAGGSSGTAGIGGGLNGSGSNIIVSAKLEVKADNDKNPPETVIAHTGEEDISSALAGLQYVTSKKPFTPTAADFTFTAPSELKYDGESKTAAVTSSKSGIGTVTVEYYCGGKKVTEAKDAGDYTIKINVAEGDSYTAETGLTADSWKFTIEKRTVTLTSATDIKEYDGTPLTNDEITESGDGFVTGQGVVLDVTGTQTELGSSENIFTYEPKAGTKPGNYTITTVFGTLTVADKVFEVSFDLAGKGTDTPKTQKVASGSCASKPTDPTYQGWTFLGWFKEEAAKAFEFTTKIFEDVKLFAHWEEAGPTEEWTVSFDVEGVDSRKVKDGDAIGDLPVVSKSGYEFKGWAVNTEVELKIVPVPVDKTYIVEKDVLLHAVFTQNQVIDGKNAAVAIIKNETNDISGPHTDPKEIATVGELKKNKAVVVESEIYSAITQTGLKKYLGFVKDANELTFALTISLEELDGYASGSTVEKQVRYLVYPYVLIGKSGSTERSYQNVENDCLNGNDIIFRLAVPSGTTEKYAKVNHRDDTTRELIETSYSLIQTAAGTGEKYVEVKATGFSYFELSFTDTKPQPKPDDGSSDNGSGTARPVKTGTWGDPVTDGTWIYGTDGKWMYKTNAYFKSTWGFIRNPYAKEGQEKDSWFLFDANGKMLTGWQFIDGKWYFLNPVSDGTQGRCYLDTTTPDGCKVDKNGAWIR